MVVRCLAFAVVQALMRPRVNAGVNAGTLASLCSACRAESIFKATAGLSVCVSTVSFGLHRRGFVYSGNWEGRMNVVLSVARYVSPVLGCAVLIECARAGGPSMAMKLRRELSPPVFVVVVNYRRLLIASRVGCASARKLFFSSARWGWGSERGRGLAVRAITSTRGRKNGILILGRG